MTAGQEQQELKSCGSKHQTKTPTGLSHIRPHLSSAAGHRTKGPLPRPNLVSSNNALQVARTGESSIAYYLVVRYSTNRGARYSAQVGISLTQKSDTSACQRTQDVLRRVSPGYRGPNTATSRPRRLIFSQSGTWLVVMKTGGPRVLLCEPLPAAAMSPNRAPREEASSTA